MSGRLLRRGAWALAVLLLVVLGGSAAFAILPPFDGSRRALAEMLLERLIDRPVTIEGQVGLRPGRLTELTLEGVTVGDAGPEAWRGTLALDRAHFVVPTLPALLGQVSLHRAAGQGLLIELDGQAESGSGSRRASALVRPIAQFLASPLTRSIELDDVRILRRAGADGWSGEVALTRATAEIEPDGIRRIRADGAFNDRPFSLDGRFSDPETTGGDRPARRFSIEASLPGLEEKLDGRLGSDGEWLEADVAVTVDSIGELLETLLLQRQLEGTGRLRMQVRGPVDELAADGVRLDVELASGETASLEGRVADLSTLSGIDLALVADLEGAGGGAVDPGRGFDVGLRRLSGRLTGSLAALTVSGLEIGTSLASADLADIGPIRIERVTRDRAGRLGLQGLTIRNGDPASPSLDLRGSVADLLGGNGIELAGSFDLDLLEVATGRPSPPSLGRLAGTLALSDASGRLRLVRLRARQVGTGELSLVLEKPAPQPDNRSPPIAVSLEIPDLDALAAAQGAAPIGGGAATFEGTLAVAENMRLVGRSRVGRSSVWIDLAEDVVDGRIALRGALRSPGLRLADLPRITGLATLWAPGEDPAAAAAANELGVTPDPGLSLDAELDTDATIVDGAGREEGAFSAKLTVRDRVLALRPLQLRYLGGQAFAELSLDLTAEPPPLRLDAKIEALRTGQLLNELGIQPLLVGALDATMALTASGSDEAALRRTLDGTVALSMGEGRIGSRLIDLTAQNLVSWLFSAGSATRLLCAATRLRFAAGVGTMEGLILKTENVQLLGTGTVDLARETMDLQFDPRPSRGTPLQTATPFRVHGPLGAPQIELRSTTGLAGRAVIEALTLPLNVLGAIFGGGGREAARCTLEP